MTEKELHTKCSERLAELRLAHNLSARELSGSFDGWNDSYINTIESRKSFPSWIRLYTICKYFNMTLSEFFDTDGFSAEIDKTNSELDQIIHMLRGRRPSELRKIKDMIEIALELPEKK